MTRPEAAEPTMDEILASIRKIIAEEPVGSRPLPGGPARVPRPEAPVRQVTAAAPSPVVAPAPINADPFGMPRSTSQASTGPEREPAANRAPIDPVAEAMARAVAPRSQAPLAPQTGANLPPPDDKMFGRLAEALRGGPAASQSPGPAPFGKPAVSDDLADLLDEPAAVSGAGASPSSAHTEPVNDEVQDRTINRRAIDFGAIIPQRSQSVAAEAPAVAPPTSSDGAPRSAKPSAHAEAFDKMLSARLAPAKAPEAPVAPPVSEGPVVIAAMPEHKSAAAASAPVSAAESAAVDDPDTAASDEAKSALGALMAGLAAAAPASAPAPAVDAAPLAAPAPASTQKAVEPAKKPATAETTVASAGASPAAAVDTPATRAKLNGATVQDAGTAAPPQPPRSEARITVSPARIVRETPAAAASRPPVAPPPPNFSADVTPADPAAAPAASPEMIEAGAPAAPQPAASTKGAPAAVAPTAARPAPAAAQLPAMAAMQLQGIGGTPVLGASVSPQGVRTVEDIVAELLRPMLREWLAENMPRMVEKALRIELADSLKQVGPAGAAPAPDKMPEKGGPV